MNENRKFLSFFRSFSLFLRRRESKISKKFIAFNSLWNSAFFDICLVISRNVKVHFNFDWNIEIAVLKAVRCYECHDWIVKEAQQVHSWPGGRAGRLAVRVSCMNQWNMDVGTWMEMNGYDINGALHYFIKIWPPVAWRVFWQHPPPKTKLIDKKGKFGDFV